MVIQAVVPLVWGSAAGGPVGQVTRNQVFDKNLVSQAGLPGKVDGSSGVQSNNYWSSTTNANNTSNAWNVNLNNGNVNNTNKTNNNYVWPVRGGE